MNLARSVAALLLAMLPALGAHAAENQQLLSLATCTQSWLDWHDDPAKGKAFFESLQVEFHQQDDGSLVPTTSAKILGYPIRQIYPESAGMAVGFSIAVDASFRKVKASLETQMGYRLEQCESDPEMTTCAHTVGENKTIMLVANGKGEGEQSLFGCVYMYEK